VAGYVQRLLGVHIDMVRNRGSKGMDGCPLTNTILPFHVVMTVYICHSWLHLAQMAVNPRVH
jgi:hypothetical protein